MAPRKGHSVVLLCPCTNILRCPSFLFALLLLLYFMLDRIASDSHIAHGIMACKVLCVYDMCAMRRKPIQWQSDTNRISCFDLQFIY